RPSHDAAKFCTTFVRVRFYPRPCLIWGRHNPCRGPASRVGVLVVVGILLFFLGEISFLGQRLSAPALQQFFALIRKLHGIVLLGDIAFGLGLAWMGYTIWKEKGEFISTG